MPKIVFLVPEGLLLVVWSSVGLWVGLVCGSVLLCDALGWVWVSRLVGWVEEIGPTDNSGRTDRQT